MVSPSFEFGHVRYAECQVIEPGKRGVERTRSGTLVILAGDCRHRRRVQHMKKFGASNTTGKPITSCQTWRDAPRSVTVKVTWDSPLSVGIAPP